MNKYKIEKLSNKIPLITIPVKGAATITALVMVRTGSKYETRSERGISHFLEHLFFKGTVKRPTTLALSGELDSLGGEYNAFTSKEYTGYWIKVAAPKFKKGLEIISDMLLHSRFDAEEIEREKGVIIEELKMYEDNPLMHIEDVFELLLYGDTPAGWDTIGTAANIRRFKRQDFLEYMRTQYGSRSLYVVLAGGVKPDDRRLAEQFLAGFRRNPWRDKPAVRERQTAPRLKAVYKKIDQANISLGVRAYPAGHPDEFKVKLLGIILGGSMSSRLFINLRERNGLAYYVRTSAECYTDSGYLTTQAGVPYEKAGEAVRIILAEYERIKREPVSAQELKRAKDMIQGRSLLRLEATDDLANWYGRQAILRKKMMTPGEFLNKIRKITPEELQATARKVFVARNLNLAMIGQVKAAAIKPILKLK